MKNYRLISVVVCCGLVFGCKPASAPPEMAQAVAVPAAGCQLRVGYESWDPYQFRSYDNKAAGLDIDIIQTIAEGMSCTVDFHYGSWQQLLGQFRQGELDLLLGASRTPAREAYALFSEPYRLEQFQLFVRKADTEKFAYDSVAQMVAAKHKLGVVSDYYYGEQVSALYTDDRMRPQFVESALGEQSLVLLLDEQVDGILEDSLVGMAMIRRKGLGAEVSPHQVKLPESPIYVMFSKAKVTPEQVEAFNRQLAALKQTGQYQRLLTKYQG